MATSSFDQLLAMIDEAFEGRAWHGPTLRGSLRGVAPALAAWRPARGRHNIWEVALHAAYWKYAVRRRLAALGSRGELSKRGSFVLPGSNWFVAPTKGVPIRHAWTEAIALLEHEHRRLRKVIARLSPRDLETKLRGRDTGAFTIRGIAAHDLYHAGQIQLLKRLGRSWSAARVKP